MSERECVCERESMCVCEHVCVSVCVSEQERARASACACVCVLPVDDEVLVGGLLVTHGAHPGGLLLVHLQVQRGVEALQVGAGERPARDDQTHLTQLETGGEETRVNTGHPLGGPVRHGLHTHAHLIEKCITAIVSITIVHTPI